MRASLLFITTTLSKKTIALSPCLDSLPVSSEEETALPSPPLNDPLSNFEPIDQRYVTKDGERYLAITLKDIHTGNEIPHLYLDVQPPDLPPNDYLTVTPDHVQMFPLDGFTQTIPETSKSLVTRIKDSLSFLCGNHSDATPNPIQVSYTKEAVNFSIHVSLRSQLNEKLQAFDQSVSNDIAQELRDEAAQDPDLKAALEQSLKTIPLFLIPEPSGNSAFCVISRTVIDQILTLYLFEKQQGIDMDTIARDLDTLYKELHQYVDETHL